MGQPFVGEIRLFAGNFAPAGWAFCHGQLVPIAENDVLFTLIGTTYGGDGISTFALPDLRSRVPIHMGTGPSGTTYQMGEMGGVESVALTTQQMPSHSHAPAAQSGSGTQGSPANAVFAASPLLYGSAGAVLDAPMKANAVGGAGGSQPHTNMAPYLGLSFIISLFGIFPSQT